MLEDINIKDDAVIEGKIRMAIRKEFYRRYLRSFFKGTRGVVFAFLYAWVEFSRWVKYWELLEERNNRVL